MTTPSGNAPVSPGPRLLGTAAALPATVRGNDDPIFDWIHENLDKGTGQYFKGYQERRVLAAGECIEDFMVEASRQALAQAGLRAQDVDVLVGYASISPWLNPNSLALVHERLGLAPTCWVMPINAEFSNHSAALLMADALVTAGRARTVLVACGGNWTAHVNYHTPECVSAGDGAGAAVVGLSRDATAWRVVDSEVTYETSGYGNMYMAGDVLPGAPATAQDPPFTESYSRTYYHITPEGLAEFKEFGVHEPPRVVTRLLARNALAAGDISLIPYQASSVLLDAWQAALQIDASAMLQTLAQYGNMVTANLPVNLACAMPVIRSDRAVLLGLGPEPHCTALLLAREAALPAG